MQSDIYIIVAVFVVLLVILVWIGAKMVFDVRRRNKRRQQRREEWIRRINARRDAG